MKRQSLFLVYLSVAALLSAQSVDWPAETVQANPAARWWWMGSAVDKENLSYNLREYADAGMGTLEITPIYGVKGNEAHELRFLSPAWVQMMQYTQAEASGLGMQIDMNTGTGWPFGGPEVNVDDAACKLLTEEYRVEGGENIRLKVTVSDAKQLSVARLERLMAFPVGHSAHVKGLDLTDRVKEGILYWKSPKGSWRLIAAFCGKTFQKVKRAAPGGEGWVMNHFSARAVSRYLNRFETSLTSCPSYFFNDSYEVYKADWTEGLFDEFEHRRGYKLEDYLPEFLAAGSRSDMAKRVVSDYRETLAELLQENFTRQWTDWAHRLGAGTRNQAHGSPGNLIDLYATVDIPECEGFGLSDFGIRGLRKDSLTRPNDSDLSMLKYASSAAHIAGKPYTSSETFTWLTEHFRTSLSQCKPDLDLMFVSGVNHVYFHGTTYSPADAEWPGWKFYASVDMSPTNSIWRDAPAFFQYITRCQSFLQLGKPDNDFLLYLPVYDLWHEQDGRLLMFDIHKMSKRAPRFIEAVHRINAAGYDMDYISDQFIRSTRCEQGKIVTSGGSVYKALIVPGARLMPDDVLKKLLLLAQQGATIVFLDQYPEGVPGLNHLAKRSKVFEAVLKEIKLQEGKNIWFGTDYVQTLARTSAKPEVLKTSYGLSCIRRSNADGYHYFISALTDQDTEAWIPLSVPTTSAVLFNPLDGSKGKALLRQRNGQAEVYLQLVSGQSVILKTFTTCDVQVSPWLYSIPLEEVAGQSSENVLLGGQWGFKMQQSAPVASQIPDSVTLGSWTDLPFPESTTLMGTACYSKSFYMDETATAYDWLLNLGDVRESARVRINGKDVITLWTVPYQCRVGKYLQAGWNSIEVKVTNLPANRIADMDRKGKNWRIFKDINIAALGYKKGNYASWKPVDSGLLGPVSLTPLKLVKCE